MGWLMLLAAILVLPLLAVAIDATASLRSRSRTRDFTNTTPNDDFEILVPIYGSVDYLENIDYLAGYGAKVLLCTTAGETQQFYDQLYRLCFAHGFRLFVADFGRTDNLNKRSTSGTIRDRLIRDALPHVSATYVVPLDADTTTTEPLQLLVGELARSGYDLASVRLVPHNTNTLLARLQAYEYRLAMQFRFLATWLVSGACHVARTAVLTDVMNRHSLFFQGNDVETGLIARLRGYRVGHIPFEVPTIVPATLKPWLRQRLAWAGGEFRLFIVNFRYVIRHPYLWIYGGLITIAFFPLRWLSFTSHPGKLEYCTGLAVTLALYAALVVRLHWKHRTPGLLLMPLYMLATTLILTPLGIAWYAWMAYKDHNLGLIKPHRPIPLTHRPSTTPEPAHTWVRNYI